MTLTLDEVRDIRFHMARRAGYEVTDVDNFVDKVETTMAQMADEIAMLKRQSQSLDMAHPGGNNTELQNENQRLREQLEAARKSGPPPELTRQLERLRQENEELRRERDDAASQGGSVGGAQSLRIVTSEQASPAVVRLVQLATEQAEQLVNEARQEAKRTLDEANRKAHEITVDARTRAERVESEARVNAEKVTASAQINADNLTQEVNARRTELFGELERERDGLVGRVAELRDFEKNYRKSMTVHLKNQVETLERGMFEPQNKPTFMDSDDVQEAPGLKTSATPRLDALLGGE